jgi:type IV pilus assembly protein PilY1
MSKATPLNLRRRLTLCAAAATLVAAVTSALSVTFAAPAPLAIAQVPLTIAIPPHPQVLWAVPNSESTDGTLSGAIMTGSGALPAALSVLQSSSSPVNYTIPAGFTPPLNPGAGGVAPYTVTVGGVQYDNSSSRLNNAKAGISAVINTYMAEVDFALETFSAGAGGPDTTWLYLMSPNGGFVFTNLPGASEYAANPCYNFNPAAVDAVSVACQSLNVFYGAQNIGAQQYVLLSASSDDPSVNDVLYAGGLAPLCVVYGGPNPASPFPPNRTLAQYETGGITVGYTSKNPVGAGCALATGPTNAGFVPYSTQVMYLERGFGYIGGASPTTGTVLVPMQTSGATPTPVTVNAAIAKFTPYLAPETNKAATTEIKAVAIQSPIAGLLKGALAYYTGATKPGTSNGCPNALQYVVLVSDGLPTQDLANHNWPPLGSASAAGYGVFAGYNANGSLNIPGTNDQAMIDTINQITALAAVGIKTYVIGLGAGVDPVANPQAAAALTAMAVAGNTSAYFPATTELALTVDMQVILAKVLAETQSVATGAVNSTGLQTGSVLYQGQFTTSDSFQDWTGNLYAFPLVFNANGQVPTLPIDAQWSAQTQLDAQAWDVGRMIVTWDPVTKAGTPFQWNPALAPDGISAATALGTALQTFVPDPNGQDVLQFLRGSNAKEVRNGGQFRNRTHKLGDIVFSAPLYVQAPVGLSQTASYLAFAQANKARQAMIYVGANDGMLHAINASTGNEQWAYVPAGVWNNLVKLVNPYYNEQHQFYVNGSPEAYDVQFGAVWHTLLIGGMGAGGMDIYGIDVTNPTAAANENQLSTQVLWDFTDADMGYSYSNPAAQQVSAGWLVFFGNGYDSPQGKPFLYAINPQTGAIVQKIDLCLAVAGVCNLGVTNGLSSVSVVNSGGQLSGIANLVYAGDLQGNLWRIDVSNANPGAWTVSVMFQAYDSVASQPQPITVTPAVSLNPRFPQLLGTMVYFGTGQLLTIADLTNNQVQSVYGIYDPPAAYPSPINRTSLVTQTLAAGPVASTGQATRTITGNPVSLPANKGWDVDLNLPTSGALSAERDVTDPQLIAGGVLLTSYQPSTSQCTLGGGAYLLDFNFATGGSFTNAQFTTPTGTTIGTAATVGLSMGSWYAPAPAVVNAGGSYVAIVTTGNGGAQCGKAGCPQGQGVVGLTQHRKAWWEIL